MPDRPALIEARLNRNGRPPDAEVCGWQIVVAQSTEPAHIGLQREYEIADEIAAGGRGPAIFIWRSQPALIVTRSQTHWPGFAAAAVASAQMGWPVLVRRSGGGTFPIGPGTVQLAMMAKYPGQSLSMDRVYDRLGILIRAALADFCIAALAGDAPGAFCDGRHDLVVDNRKIAGLAQHWRPCGRAERCVTASASVLVGADLDELTQIIDRFHMLCGQTIAIRREAMTTVRDNCNPGASDNLPEQFATRLAAAGRRAMRSSY